MFVLKEEKKSLKEKTVQLTVSDIVEGLTELMKEKVVAFKQYSNVNTLRSDSCIYADFRVAKINKDSFCISDGQSYCIIHFDKLDKILMDKTGIGVYFKDLSFTNLTFKSSQYFQHFVGLAF